MEIGNIAIWDSAEGAIPNGWALCDGTNGTPDLRDKFIIGAGSSYAAGAVGGSKDAVVISHDHDTFSTGWTQGSHRHNFNSTSSTSGSHSHGGVKIGGSHYNAHKSNDGTGAHRATPGGPTLATDYSGSHSHSTPNTSYSGYHNHSANVGTSGESGTDKNLPPYYALYYVMKVSD